MTDNACLLDTHIWIWLALDRTKIRPAADEVLREAGSRSDLCISAISLFEVANLVDRKRIDLKMPLGDWFHLSFSAPALPVIPVTPEVALASLTLPQDFHRDPNDRLIASTAIAYNLIFCTHDEYLIHFGKQGLYRYLEI
jgi:PIN domain nuclease of toxin-antitoxin system